MMQQFSFNNCTASIQYYQRAFRSHSVSINFLDKLKIQTLSPSGVLLIFLRENSDTVSKFSQILLQEIRSRAMKPLSASSSFSPLILQDQPFSHFIGKIAFVFLFLAGKSTFWKSPATSLIFKPLFDSVVPFTLCRNGTQICRDRS